MNLSKFVLNYIIIGIINKTNSIPIVCVPNIIKIILCIFMRNPRYGIKVTYSGIDHFLYYRSKHIVPKEC